MAKVREKVKNKRRFREDEKVLRDHALLARRLQGAKISELQAEFGMAEHTVRRHLDRVRRSAIVQSVRDHVLLHLVPLSVEVYEVALRQGDTDVAAHVLETTGVLPKDGKEPLQPGEVETSYEVWRARRLLREAKALNPETVEQAPAAAAAGEVMHGDEDHPYPSL